MKTYLRISLRFLISSKQAFVEDINNVLKRLVKDEYVKKSGSASRLIYGEKGIGKSSALTLSVMGNYLGSSKQCHPGICRICWLSEGISSFERYVVCNAGCGITYATV